jgi:hypothetical protein
MTHLACRSSGAAPTLECLERRLMLAGQAPDVRALWPALFVENQGQWADRSVHYGFDGAGCDIGFGDSHLDVRLTRPVTNSPDGSPDLFETTGFQIEFGGDRPTAPVGLGRAEAGFSYLVGDSTHWRADVGAYSRLAYVGLYPGIDLEITGLRTGLKYEFRVAPGADYRAVEMTYRGADGLHLDESGALHVVTSLGELVDAAPRIYQELGGQRVEVSGQFRLIDADTCGFVITGPCDAGATLVIDPDLAWASYLGGTGYDEGNAIAADAAGNLYVTGRTESAAWASAGAYDPSYNGSYDAFAAKLNSGGNLLWCTYLGGEGYDAGYGIAVDGAGSAYVTGETASASWATAGAFDTTLGGTRDVFVAKLASDGASLAYCTYLGGASQDLGQAVAVDAGGSAYVTGYTDSTGWATGGAYDTTHNGNRDAFVGRLDAAGAQLLFCTYLGGIGYDVAYDIALDSSGAAYVAGETASTTWATAGAYDTTHNGNADAFAAKVSATGSQLVYATYLGGTSQDIGYGVAVDASGAAYVTGQSFSAGWATAEAFDNTHNGNADGFVAKISPTGSQLAYATYFGGAGQDLGYGIAVDAAGAAYITGQTSSTDLATSSAYDTAYDGNGDAFVAKFSASGSHLLYATYLGGTDADMGNAVALDAVGAACVAGKTASSAWAASGSYAGGTDIFVARVAVSDLPADISVWDGMTEIVDGQAAPIEIGQSAWGGPGAARTFTIRNDGDEPLTLVSPFADTAHFVVGEPDRASLGPGETASFIVTLKTDTAWSGAETISLASSDADENPFEFAVSGTVTAPATITVGTVHASVDKPHQRLAIYVTGGVMVAGFNLRAQIGDGPGGAAEPVFTGVDFAGGIWDAHPVTVVGGPVAGAPQYAQASVVFTGSGDETAAQGLLVTLVIDTTGFAQEQAFELRLSATGIGLDCDFITTGGGTFVPTIQNGIIQLHDAEVVGRCVFYNHSYFDGNNPAAGAADDQAIDPTKQAMLPGGTATIANYTSYSRGINGLMVDIHGMAGVATAADFVFRAGTTGDPGTWALAAAPQGVSVRPGAGIGGSSRVTIIWADQAIMNQWLQVTVLGNGQTTGLGSPDVFYFGHALGETLNSAANAIVDSADFANVRDHPHFVLNRASVSDACDINRDSFVDGTDLVLVRDHGADQAAALPLISVPVVDGMGAAAVLGSEPAFDVATAPSTPAATIDVGQIHLTADSTAQRIPLYVGGAAMAAGFNLRAQLGDGPGGADEPVFTAVDFAGGIWDAQPVTVVGGPVTRAPQFAQASAVFTAARQESPAGGLLVTLVVDTTGFDQGQTFPLKLSATGIGLDCDFVAVGGSTFVPSIQNGTIHLSSGQAPPFEVHLDRKYTFADADGQQVTVSLKGPGECTLLFDTPFSTPVEARQDLRGIVLADSTTASKLSVKTRGRGSQTRVGDITVYGALGALNAPTTDLAGDLTIDKGLGSLRLDDLLGSNDLVINRLSAAVDPRLRAAIRLDETGPAVTLTSYKEPIRSLTVASWSDAGNAITAASLAGLLVRGGNLGGQLTLTGDGNRYVLGGVKIKGALSGATWNLTGNVGNVRVYGPCDAALTASGEIRSLIADSWTGGAITAGAIRSLKTTGRRASQDPGQMAAALTLLGGVAPLTLGKVGIRGAVSNVWDITGQAGAIAVVGDPQGWRLDVHGSLRSLKAGMLSGAEVSVANLLGSLKAMHWDGGKLSVGRIDSLKLTGDRRRKLAGDLRAVECDVTGAGAVEGQDVLRRAYVKGTVAASQIRIDGPARSVNVGRLADSKLLLGATELTGSLHDFDDPQGSSRRHRLGVLILRGAIEEGQARYFDASWLGAWDLGVVKFARRPGLISGQIEFHQWAGVVNEPDLSSQGELAVTAV